MMMNYTPRDLINYSLLQDSDHVQRPDLQEKGKLPYRLTHQSALPKLFSIMHYAVSHHAVEQK